MNNTLRNLRIADLELFISAAKMRNLGQAASFHHLSQSAASTAIQRVEAGFNASLCTHAKKQFGLTREGQLLLPKMEQAVAHIHNLLLSKEITPIRLATTHALAKIILPALIEIESIDFMHKRLDLAYEAVVRGEADLALVLDNAPWKEISTTQIGQGHFQLFCKDKQTSIRPVLLPEDQIEVLSLQQNWRQTHGKALPIKSRVPSWSLIAEICANTAEVGFLPDFLAKKLNLHPVSWQPKPRAYKILALHRFLDPSQEQRVMPLLEKLRELLM